jgi:hypothetical protein
MKVGDWIGNVGRGRGIWMTGSRNAKANGKSLKLLEVVYGTSAERAGSSVAVECQRKHRGGRREARRPLSASIYDRHTERRYWQYFENGNDSSGEKLINYRE